MKTPHATLSRRKFLFAATAGSAAATGALIARNKAPQADSVEEPRGESKSGYQLTEHVRNYYRTAKI
jgi:hypothetical protein